MGPTLTSFIRVGSEGPTPVGRERVQPAISRRVQHLCRRTFCLRSPGAAKRRFLVLQLQVPRPAVKLHCQLAPSQRLECVEVHCAVCREAVSDFFFIIFIISPRPQLTPFVISRVTSRTVPGGHRRASSLLSFVVENWPVPGSSRLRALPVPGPCRLRDDGVLTVLVQVEVPLSPPARPSDVRRASPIAARPL